MEGGRGPGDDRYRERRRPVRSLQGRVARGLLAAGLVAAAGPSIGQDPGATKVPDAVLRTAQIQGKTRVIVQLAAAWAPEARLAASAQAAQRLGIESMQRSVLGALTGTGAALVRNFETVPFQALEVTPAALTYLEAHPLVVGVQPDRLYRPLLAQSGPLVQADQAWTAGRTGAGKMVAILDTGVDKAHSFFGGRVVAEACFSANGNCPNGQTQQIGTGTGVPCTYASEDCRHGTHVGGIAAGSGSTFSGIAKGAQVMSVQVFSRFTGAQFCGGGPGPCALSYISDQIAALEHVYDRRNDYSIASVNMSLGGGLYTSFCDSAEAATKAAIDNLRSAGIATVIASGNDGSSGSISAPACVSSAVSVGSTTKSDGISAFSNSASILKLLAPGSGINSSVPGGGFLAFGGTSMATPHVAGAWAILKQHQPNATVDQVLNALTNTGLAITDPRNNLTKRRIRVKAAMDSFGSPAAITSPAPGTALSGPTATFSWNTGTNVTAYWLYVGTGLGAKNIHDSGQISTTSRSVSGLPTNGSTVYVRLWSMIGGSWAGNYRDYTYTAVNWPNLTVNDVAVTEGSAGTVNAVFTVTLSGSTSQTVTVQYSTANSTASAPGDYTAASGSLTFSGPSTRTVSVPVKGDVVPEVHETFFLHLSDATNANMTDDEGIGTIIDDDSSIAVSATSAFTGQQIQVTLTGPGTPRDWAGMLSTASPDAGPLLDWQYLNGSRTVPPAGFSSATLTFTLPSTPGTYNFRFYPDDGFVSMAVSATVTVTVNSTPAIEVSPSSLSFGSVYVGSTKDLAVTVTNRGGGTLSGSASVSGAGLTIVGDASYSLGTNQADVITVRFAPGTPGPASGSLTLSGGGGASVPLSGTGVTPPSLTPSTVTASPGDTITVTVSNGPGNTTDWVGMHAATGPDTAFLDWKYLNETRTAPPSAFTSATLNFTLPFTPGTYNFRLFASNGFTKVATSATVTVQDAPVLQVTPGSLAFGNVVAGSSKDLAVTVKNVGGGTLAGSGGVAGTGFSPVGGTSYSLAANQTKVLTVRFAPVATGAASGQLTLSGGGGAIVPLSGSGVNPPSVSVSTTQATPGQTVTVTVAAGPGNPTDWVGLFSSGAADNVFLDWKYLNGTRTAPGAGTSGAAMSFTMPTTTGTYNFRFFANNGFTKLATSPAVSVAPSTTPVLEVAPSSLPFGGVSLGSSRDLMVTVKNAGGGTLTGNASVTGAGFSLVGASSYSLGASQTQMLTVRFAPAGLGAASGTLNLTSGGGGSVGLSGTGVNGPTLTVNRTTVGPGGTVVVTVTNGPGNARDWLGLHSAAGADTAFVDWKYLNGTRTAPANGLTSATVSFTMPTALGTYNFRFFANNTYQKLATSFTVTVQALTPTLTPSVATATPEQAINVTVSDGPGSGADWVGLFAAGAADTSYLAWNYLNGQKTPPPAGLPSATLGFAMPTAPGTYEFRLFSNGGYTRLATSGAVTVQ